MKEIESLAQLEAHLAAHKSLAKVVLQNLDLHGHSELLREVSVKGAVFLGCYLAADIFSYLQASGAILFPRLEGLVFEPYRSCLYTPEELYQGFDRSRPESYQEATDAKIYQHWKLAGGMSPASILETLSQRLHDHAIKGSSIET